MSRSHFSKPLATSSCALSNTLRQKSSHLAFRATTAFWARSATAAAARSPLPPPVVTTPNAGSVVRDGVDGFVCAAGDVDALCDRISRLSADPDLVVWMGRNARARAAEFDVAAYGRRLWAAFDPSASAEMEKLPCAV